MISVPAAVCKHAEYEYVASASERQRERESDRQSAGARLTSRALPNATWGIHPPEPNPFSLLHLSSPSSHHMLLQWTNRKLEASSSQFFAAPCHLLSVDSDQTIQDVNELRYKFRSRKLTRFYKICCRRPCGASNAYLSPINASRLWLAFKKCIARGVSMQAIMALAEANCSTRRSSITLSRFPNLALIALIASLVRPPLERCGIIPRSASQSSDLWFLVLGDTATEFLQACQSFVALQSARVLPVSFGSLQAAWNY